MHFIRREIAVGVVVVFDVIVPTRGKPKPNAEGEQSTMCREDKTIGALLKQMLDITTTAAATATKTTKRTNGRVHDVLKHITEWQSRKKIQPPNVETFQFSIRLDQ